MSIQARVEEYVAMRRTLGFKLVGDARLLREFAQQLDRNGQSTVTVAAALAWATQPQDVTPSHWRRRLDVVRCFTRHLNTLDPRCEIPPPGLLFARTHRPTPYHYTAEEIAALVHAAGTITAPLPAATIQAVIGLIAASGIRLGEALALDRGDVDLQAGILTVTGKNDTTRLLPLHYSTVAMLTRYTTRRDILCPAPACSAFFITTTGHRLQQRWAQQTFAKLLTQSGIHAPAGRRRPRIHDLRHTFAVNVLIGWYQSGVDVQAHLPILSTFLGHTSPEATYWYLQATPQLLALAADRLSDPRSANQPAILGAR